MAILDEALDFVDGVLKRLLPQELIQVAALCGALFVWIAFVGHPIHHSLDRKTTFPPWLVWTPTVLFVVACFVGASKKNQYAIDRDPAEGFGGRTPPLAVSAASLWSVLHPAWRLLALPLAGQFFYHWFRIAVVVHGICGKLLSDDAARHSPFVYACSTLAFKTLGLGSTIAGMNFAFVFAAGVVSTNPRWLKAAWRVRLAFGATAAWFATQPMLAKWADYRP